MNNVVTLPTPRKRGRRRLHPIPNVLLGSVVEFPGRFPTAAEQLADYQDCVEEVARGLLMAIKAVTALHRKYPGT